MSEAEAASSPEAVSRAIRAGDRLTGLVKHQSFRLRTRLQGDD